MSANGVYVLAKEKHFPATGTTIHETKKMVMNKAEVNIQMQGQEIKGTATSARTEENKLEFLANHQIRETEIRSEDKNTMMINGQESPSPSMPSPMLNVPVLLKKAEDKWIATLESGAEPNPLQKIKLAARAKEQNRDPDLLVYGSTPRKVGESWTVDAADVFFGEDAEGGKGELKLTFKGVESYEGKQCARLEGPAKFSGKSTRDGAEQAMTFDGNIVVLRSLDDMVDLQRNFNGRMTMKMGLPGDGTLQMNGDITMEENARISR